MMFQPLLLNATGLVLDLSHDTHPTKVYSWRNDILRLPPNGTHYGMVTEGSIQVQLPNVSDGNGRLWRLMRGQFFVVTGHATLLAPDSTGLVITRLGYQGLNQIGGPIEARGRLKYIDGCSDTLLVCPPLLGEPCLNHLHIPPLTNQTAHTHPSSRIGVIMSGRGACQTPEGFYPLTRGLGWYIPTEQVHSFHTDDSSLHVLAWHPDSDFGPTDKDHPMLNRSYVQGVSAAALPAIQTKRDHPLTMRKQDASNAYFADLYANAPAYISREAVEARAAATIEEIGKVIKGRRAAIAWSGGKDSLALTPLAEAAGIRAGVLGLSKELEYPELEAWFDAHGPGYLDIVRTPQCLNFLRAHPHMLFPTDSQLLSRWYQIKQIAAQKRFCQLMQVDVLLLGRRTADGNYIGRGIYGTHLMPETDTIAYCPLRDWSHEEVLGLLHYRQIAMPPNYSWPYGWLIGSGSWPVNNYAKLGYESGWEYVFDRDPGIVQRAARVLDSARDFLFSREFAE